MTTWINALYKKPPVGENVLIWEETWGVMIGWIDDYTKGFVTAEDNYPEVKWWMPLPKSPYIWRETNEIKIT